ncbi:MAG TPA: peroxide stress protein YaaA, partial [Ramlibacter sp.]|nr:peroxide stress protein YaaA [Ramlibacter sp.]
MLFLLSPAKTLDFDTPTADLPHGRPHFARQSAELIEVLRQRTPAQVASLMAISDKLASLNVARYQAWSPRFTARNSRQAVLAFNGDVYDGLQARTLA